MSEIVFQISQLMALSGGDLESKRIGYWAASSLFQSRQALLMSTNSICKDLNSKNHMEIGLALNFLAVVFSKF